MTEQQIIETLATKVMGWSELESIFYEEAKSFPAFYLRDTGGCGVVEKESNRYIDYDWNPLQNIADAWQVVEKFGSMEQFDIRRIKFMGLIPIKIYDITPKAICETALKAVA
ncbi:hypothetical protein HP398_29810 [Brevibacillus sp. HB1.4B]|uniref:BC1872 family protein n=1 Tax=Brevibacillus sp. HB1.4B TaxID=2738845 RepID=UPI00156B879A|nr:hypothetical protein [Brevibacillus sp. HB1.4B]NRS20619.1 hypothetical protein [Brevibacillus sp. HB1.4B]